VGVTQPIPPREGTASGLLTLIAPVCVLLFALVLQVFIKPLMGDYASKVLLDIGVNIVLAVSLTMVNGFTGQFSMGHAAFMLVGAYVAGTIMYYGSFALFGNAGVHGGRLSSMMDGRAVAWLTSADGMFLGALLAGGVVAAVCGYLVGLPSLRLRGDYLAIVTLGFGEIMRVLIQAQTRDVLYTQAEIDAVPAVRLPLHVGGALGFTGLPFYTNLFWVFLFAGATVLIAYRLKNSTFGRAFLSIREDEIASEAMGVNTTRYKVRAFVISAFFAGCAGGLFAHTVGVQLNPGELGFMKSFDIIIMVVLGGLGSISGAALAAALLAILPEWLRNPGHVWPLGLLMLVTVLVLGGKARLKGALVVVGTFAAIEVGRYFAVANGVDLSKYRMILYALMLIMMMILRPKGLLGVQEVWNASLWRGIWDHATGKAAKGETTRV